MVNDSGHRDKPENDQTPSDPQARPAVVLLSGGLDSATVLAVAISQGFRCHCLSFDYGQRHRSELRAAAAVAKHLGATEHVVMSLDLRAFGGSALTADIDVPKDRSGSSMGDGIPVTYVPARNLIFLSIAMGLAEVRRAGDIFIGVNAVDYSGYPDCRPEFVESFQRTANLATKVGVDALGAGRLGLRIEAPLVNLSKAQIIRLGRGLGVDYSLTHSCYDPDPSGQPCGRCDSCVLRREGFAAAGMNDQQSEIR